MKLAMAEEATGTSTISSDMWTNAQNILTPQQFNELKTDYIKQRTRQDGLNAKANNLLKVFSSPDHWGEYTDKEQTAAFGATAAALKQREASKGRQISDFEAETNTAMIAGGPVKAYVDKLSNMLQSVDPAVLDQAGAAIQMIDEHNKGENLRGLSEKDLAVWDMYHRLNQAGGNHLTNAQLAHDRVYAQNKDQQKANDESFIQFIRGKRNKLESSSATAMRLADIPSTASFNLPLLAADTESFMKAFWSASNGDEKTTESLTKRAISNKYGIAYYNGREEFLANPLTKYLNIPEDGNGVIHNDVAEQVNKQFLQTNQLYFQGKSDFWWEVKPDITSEQAAHAKRELDKAKRGESSEPINSMLFRVGLSKHFGALGWAAGKLAPEIKQAAKSHVDNQEILDRFNYGQPPTVIQHFRDGSRKQYTLSIQASPILGRDDKNRIVGGWYINLKTPTGTMPIPLSDPIAGPDSLYAE